MKYKTAASIVYGVVAIVILSVVFDVVVSINKKVEAPAPTKLIQARETRCPDPPPATLEVLRAEVETLIVRHHVIIWEGGSRENDATKELRSLLAYSLECWGVMAGDLGITFEVWKSFH